MKKIMKLSVLALAASFLLTGCAEGYYVDTRDVASILDFADETLAATEDATSDTPETTVDDEAPAGEWVPYDPTCESKRYDDEGECLPKYKRDLFGKPWADVDGNGCDTRNDMLMRDLEPGMLFKDGKFCKVGYGWLVDRFSGDRVEFVHGQKTSADVPIDHIVPLHEFWYMLGYKVSEAERVAMANDPDNLTATTRVVNTWKSDKLPSDLLASDELNNHFSAEGKCFYATQYDIVVAKYDLPVAYADQAALDTFRSFCTA